MEVGLGIGLAAGPEEPLPLPAAHVAHVLAHVRHPLLLHRLVRRPRLHLQMALEATCRRTVRKDRVLLLRTRAVSAPASPAASAGIAQLTKPFGSTPVMCRGFFGSGVPL